MPEHAAPGVSVVIPVYERAHSVRPTLESVRGQTYTDWECVVVDDGSSDGDALRAVVDGLQDDRFRYLRRPNGGGGAARNTGVEAARGDFIAFLDSDDAFLPTKLERLLDIADASSRTAYASFVLVDRGDGAGWVRPDRPPRPDEPIPEFLFVANQVIQTSSLMLPTWLAREVPFDPSLRKGQDLDLVVRLAAAGVRVEMIEAPLVIWKDVSEENRTSRHAGADAPTRWLERARPLMSERAAHGYRATVLAYYVAPERPWRALAHIVVGGARGRVGARVLARQLLRCFLPRRTYRAIVNAFVRRRGRPLEDASEHGDTGTEGRA
jgi:glycosyltransferase involved in cell wall biosynthesis